jgi:hypothetical protein
MEGDGVMSEGRCHCGAIAYRVAGKPKHHALCHCSDCRRHAGAPMVSWALFKAGEITILRGTPKVYASSTDGRRHFCADCGTGLFYTNEKIFPGMMDIQSSTLDNPSSISPTAQVQIAERIGWMATAHTLPAFERYPSG